uniref:non-specific serine/threonine protein kinase n=1 Tax=Chenopodium quinoa TaxID=63459 RepID=A0A803KMT8_CHEQI
MGATTVLVRTNAMVIPKNMITTANTTKSGCQRKCGNLTIPYPFGIGYNCSFPGSYGFNLICNTSYNPPRAFTSVDGFGDILDITETQTTVRNTFMATLCYDSQGNEISPSGEGLVDYLDIGSSPFTISKTANKLTVIGCNNYGVFDSSGGYIGDHLRVGCISLCSKTEPVPGSCLGGCCQASIPFGSQNFALAVHGISAGGDPESCSYSFYGKLGSFTFGGASDLTRNNFDVVRNKILDQVSIVFDWNVQLNTSCKKVKMSNSSINPYLCQSNTRCIDTAEGGYRCSCLPGYEGNPYLKPGCTDINECIAGPNNPCTTFCVNTPGSFICFCSDGYTGDGLSSGIGCIRITDKSSFLTIAIKIFTIDELERATDHFNEDRILGKGGQGTVYKGMLSEGKIVAIKMCKVVDQNQCGDFVNEVIILSNINHRNIVKLLGCCLEHETPLQVFEYIPNGTLDHHIHSPSSEFQITWRMRLQIASDLAGALAYLHSSSSIPIFHRDIKSSNILLDDKYRAKLSDFGTSKSVAIDQTHATTRVMGTFGYLDPEYYQLGQYTEKSDVYSFGVVLVELLT